MSTVKKLLGDTLGKLIFREAAVAGVRAIGASFRLLDLSGDGLRGAPFTPGDKVQVFLDEGDTRTYTPFRVDPARGTMQLLLYVHGDGPGARWGRAVAVGQRVRLFGPRGSIALPDLRGPVVLVGDETSLAVARALGDHRGASDGVSIVLEVSSTAESAAAADALGLSPALVERTGGAAALEREVRAALARTPGANLVLTGAAPTIQALRRGLRGAATGAIKSKPYWAPGKRGLD